MEVWLNQIEGTIDTTQKVWLVGDWNVDYLKMNDSTYSKKKLMHMIRNKLGNYGYKQIVEGGTHEQNGKLSCIDLIFTNKIQKVAQRGNEEVGTHHNLVYGEQESKYNS
jgi:uncharacterized membrane protein YcaP (DUF421 family)